MGRACVVIAYAERISNSSTRREECEAGPKMKKSENEVVLLPVPVLVLLVCVAEADAAASCAAGYGGIAAVALW